MGNLLSLLGVGSAAFTDPSSLQGLQLWLRGDMGAFNTVGPDDPAEDGEDVAEWRDQSSNGIVFEGGTDPTWDEEHADFNNQPVIAFSGNINEKLQATMDFMNFPDWTIFMVANGDDGTFGLNLGAGSILILSEQDDNWNIGVSDGGGDGVGLNSGAVGSASYMATVLSEGVMELFVNGVSQGTDSNPSYDEETTWEGGSNMFIGFGSMLGNIAEMIIYDRPLSAGERKQVETYLADRYSIS